VGVGIGPTKTLAKLANWAAKTWPKSEGVIDLRDPSRRDRLLQMTEVNEVWGVGHRLTARLKPLGIKTAWDLAQYDPTSLHQQFRPGYAYSKAEVLLMDLRQRGEFTGDLFAAAPRPGADRLMAVVDRINAQEGRGTVRLGRVPAAPKWTMRREMLSQRYTTRWDELMVVK